MIKMKHKKFAQKYSHRIKAQSIFFLKKFTVQNKILCKKNWGPKKNCASNIFVGSSKFYVQRFEFRKFVGSNQFLSCTKNTLAMT